MRSFARVLSGLVVLVTLVISATGSAFEVNRTPSGLPVHWEKANVTFEVDPSVGQAVDGGYDAVAEALAGWSGQAGTPTLTVTAGSGNARPGNDGHNVIFFAPHGYPAAGNALAITILSYDENTGVIVDADIIINGQHQFGVLAANAKPASNARAISNEGGDEGGGTEGEFDLLHVVAHECGHALGLRDVVSPGPLMYLYTMPGDATARTPTADDQDGIASLYPVDASASSQPASGCQSSVASTSPSPGAAGGIFVVVLILAAYRLLNPRLGISVRGCEDMRRCP